MSDLSLFGIEAGLHELMTVWQEAESPEAVQAAEVEIRAYACAEVRKVDGIRRYVRACESQAAAAKAEMTAQAQRVRMWEARRDRLKQFVFDAMQSFGVKRIEGETGSLMIKGNGGKQAVTVTDESLIPEGLCEYSGSIPGDLWQAMLRQCPQPLLDILGHRARMVRMPHNERIRAELSMKCLACDGTPRVRYEVDGTEGIAECEACGGSGNTPVAGARLENRGSHLEIR